MKIMTRRQLRNRYAAGHLPRLFLPVVLLSLILLSACSTNTGNTASSTSTAVPTPAIDSTLQNQGDMQLRSFRQWITLMQQYNGDTTVFQKQYNADQQALNNARTVTAFKAGLAKLNSHVEAIKIPAMKTESQSFQYQLQQEVTSWGQLHHYHDDF